MTGHRRTLDPVDATGVVTRARKSATFPGRDSVGVPWIIAALRVRRRARAGRASKRQSPVAGAAPCGGAERRRLDLVRLNSAVGVLGV